ncbi:MAG: AN1-type zinc finger domain-containing protein [Candidatus Heimdallarchaeaceae archaeon]
MKCEYPDCDADEPLLFYCKLCGHSFCEKHRKPQDHKCPGQYSQTPQYTQQGEPVDVRTFVSSLIRTAQQAAQAHEAQQRMAFSQLDNEQKKKFIEKRLLSSGELFSLGNEWLDIIFGFSLILLVFGFYRLIVMQDWVGFIIAGILVATAFVPHELAHKFVAIRRGQYARYVLWVRGMLWTLITLVIGIGLIVPGFVAIVPLERRMDKKDTGIVSLAGPLTNVIIGTASLLIALIIKYGMITLTGFIVDTEIFFLIAQFNALIAAFNCLPVWQLDGLKILKWNKTVFLALIIAIAVIMVPTFVLTSSNFLF